MQRSSFLSLLTQALMFCCAILMGYWVEMPWFVLAALTVCGVAALHASVAAIRANRSGRAADSLPLIIVWSCTLLALVGLFFSNRKPDNRDRFFIALAWLMAAAILVTNWVGGDARAMRRWKGPSVLWALSGSLTWMGIGYWQNQTAGFYTGLAMSAALLIAVEVLFRLPTAAVLLVNTLLALAILLPISELVFRPRYRLEASPEIAKRYYSFDVAKRDPTAFGRWWVYYGEQWQLLEKDLCIPDSSAPRTYRLRPGSEHVMFQSRVSINSKGFRGKEIAEDKGTAYRIVALGESTTFGATLRLEDRPWPEVLEQLIQDRLKPARRVEVINAGVPGWTLQDNLRRLSADILPLKPDMIISYHGFNGFRWLGYGIPASSGPLPPKYQERPIKILADAEQGLKMRLYKRQLASKGTSISPVSSSPMEGPYAQAYGRLIKAAHINGVKLVLGTFSMAVNSQSDAEVVEFYRAGFGLVHHQISANLMHSALVRQLAEEHPEVCFVDTRPHLDGENEKFIDLIHLTQPGRDQLAETFFEGIRNVLERELLEGGRTGVTNQRASFSQPPPRAL